MDDQRLLRPARPADTELLCALITEFYGVDGHPFDEAVVRGGLAGLLPGDGTGDDQGAIWLVEHAGEVIGYAVVTWGYSIESGGQEALLDELYLRARGQGIGTRVMREVLAECRRHGARRIFLETERRNTDVRRFYERSGFAVDDSIWMSRSL